LVREVERQIDRHSLAQKPQKIRIFKFSDIAQLKAEDVSFHPLDVCEDTDELLTDDAIRGRKGWWLLL
jgi:hypothetical protein